MISLEIGEAIDDGIVLVVLRVPPDLEERELVGNDDNEVVLPALSVAALSLDFLLLKLCSPSVSLEETTLDLLLLDVVMDDVALVGGCVVVTSVLDNCRFFVLFLLLLLLLLSLFVLWDNDDIDGVGCCCCCC